MPWRIISLFLSQVCGFCQALFSTYFQRRLQNLTNRQTNKKHWGGIYSYWNESAQKVDPGEENSSTPPAGTQTHNLLSMSPALYHWVILLPRLVCNVFNIFATHAGLFHNITDANCWTQQLYLRLHSHKCWFLTNRTRNGVKTCCVHFVLLIPFPQIAPIMLCQCSSPVKLSATVKDKHVRTVDSQSHDWQKMLWMFTFSLHMQTPAISQKLFACAALCVTQSRIATESRCGTEKHCGK